MLSVLVRVLVKKEVREVERECVWVEGEEGWLWGEVCPLLIISWVVLEMKIGRPSVSLLRVSMASWKKVDRLWFDRGFDCFSWACCSWLCLLSIVLAFKQSEMDVVSFDSKSRGDLWMFEVRCLPNSLKMLLDYVERISFSIGK